MLISRDRGEGRMQFSLPSTCRDFTESHRAGLSSVPSKASGLHLPDRVLTPVRAPR